MSRGMWLGRHESTIVWLFCRQDYDTISVIMQETFTGKKRLATQGTSHDPRKLFVASVPKWEEV